MNPPENANSMQLLGSMAPGFDKVLTSGALDFVTQLQRKFNARRLELLDKRQERQAEIDQGILPDYLPETQSIRDSDWKVAPVPADLQDRRVEITGPVDRKMVINALNSGASAFMADFEDSHAPFWHATVQGQLNLMDAVDGSISLTTDAGKHYQLKDKTAVLMVRPRRSFVVRSQRGESMVP